MLFQAVFERSKGWLLSLIRWLLLFLFYDKYHGVFVFFSSTEGLSDFVPGVSNNPAAFFHSSDVWEDGDKRQPHKGIRQI